MNIKGVILRILRTGQYTGKKYTMEDLKEYLPFIDNIAERIWTPENGFCYGVWGLCNGFFHPDNKKGREALIEDIVALKKPRNAPLHSCPEFQMIMIRYECGDYGVPK
jgi:hypothetical protein